MFVINLQLFGGRGGSSGGGGGSGTAGASAQATAAAAAPAPAPAPAPPQDFDEAFAAGVDFAANGWVNHQSRTVSATTQQQWDAFTAAYQSGMTAADDRALMKDYQGVDRQGNDILYGYVRTSNSFAINAALYDPNNAGKTDAQIFTRKDRRGVLRDLQTVQTLDRAIGTHTTQTDASYTRFCSPNAIQATFGLSDADMSMLQSARSMNASQLAQLNSAFAGKSSFSNAYTSTSANRSMNAFSNPNARQSQGFIFERKLNVPKGTNAFAVRRNAQESEVIFGRKLQTRMTGITISNDGHIVIHETFDGYR